MTGGPFMLDLFAGLGGASAAMRERGWRVVRVELDPRFPAEHRDVRDFSWHGERPDLVWASPPCTEFSKASMPRSWSSNRKKPPDVPVGLALVAEALRVVRECSPRWWVLENVRGARPHFAPLLGAPIARVGSAYLWGSPPPMLWPVVRPGYKWRLPPSSDRPALRSLIPYELSHALAVAVERARGISR